MTESDQIQMMQRCLGEIELLRNRIASLEPKAHAYDTLSTVVRMFPQPSQGYGEDLAWMLRREIEKMQKAQDAALKGKSND